MIGRFASLMFGTDDVARMMGVLLLFGSGGV